jgi:hypothetical protein
VKPVEHNASCADYRPAYRCPDCMKAAILEMEGTWVLNMAAIERRDAEIQQLRRVVSARGGRWEAPMVCEGPGCGVVFRPVGDNWYRIDRMHDDRVGYGTVNFHSRPCAIAWLEAQEDQP